MPSWWMPASCANAFSPTIALLRWTGMPVMLDTRRLVGNRRLRVDAGVAGRRVRRAPCSAMTTSSSEQLPARSPMPLIVHSTWRAPPRTAARLLATASPRSLWQCTLNVTPVGAAHVLLQVRDHLVELLGHGVADRVGDVDRGRAGLDRRLDHLAQELGLGARGVLRRELDVVTEAARVLHALDRRAG